MLWEADLTSIYKNVDKWKYKAKEEKNKAMPSARDAYVCVALYCVEDYTV